MIDINAMRNDLEGVAAALAKRGVALDTGRFKALEAERKTIQTRTQQLQATRNALCKQIGMAKGARAGCRAAVTRGGRRQATS